MSIVINKKERLNKNGTKKIYEYVRVVYGEGGRERYECGSTKDEKSWIEAKKKIKEILDREHQVRLSKWNQRIEHYSNLYVVSESNDIVVESYDNSDKMFKKREPVLIGKPGVTQAAYHVPFERMDEMIEAFKDSGYGKDTIVSYIEGLPGDTMSGDINKLSVINPEVKPYYGQHPLVVGTHRLIKWGLLEKLRNG